jgi:hypothetical protein
MLTRVYSVFSSRLPSLTKATRFAVQTSETQVYRVPIQNQTSSRHPIKKKETEIAFRGNEGHNLLTHLDFDRVNWDVPQRFHVLVKLPSQAKLAGGGVDLKRKLAASIPLK